MDLGQRFQMSPAAVLGAGALLAACGAAVAGAQDAPADQARSVAITVYNQDLGLVRDVRRMEIPGGTAWISFREVPSRIDPTSVHLKATDGAELTVLEQNYGYDLVSPDKILERYLDSPIKVIVEEGRLYEGRLLSAREGQLVLGASDAGGGITILSREKVTDMQFPSLPAGLITRPTLTWLLSTERGGGRDVEVSYLTGGMNWHAEYVAVVAAADDGMDLAGWVSIENHSGAQYPDARLQLVAGDVNRVPAPQMRGGRNVVELAASYKAVPAAGFEEETFFEYHLYTLQRPSTLADNETKQISLFEPATCTVKKIYEANPLRDDKAVRVVLETTNSEAAGLGMPLPKGTVRVYKRDRRDDLQFVGEDRIQHTPRDEKLRVQIGKAFDLVAERTELETRRLGPRDSETDVKIELRNRKAQEDAVIVVQEDLQGYWEIRAASHPYEKKSATRIEFAVPVAAGQTATVTYTVRVTS